jgi:hypothetical protein
MTLRPFLVAAALTFACVAATACAPQTSSVRLDVDLGYVPTSLPHPVARLGCQHLPALGPTACRLVRLINGAVAVVPANLVGPSTVLWPVP